MAFNRRNLLKRIIRVQEMYSKYKLPESTLRGVWREHIYPSFHISLRTLEEYLQKRAVHELKQLENGTEQGKSKFKQTALEFPSDEPEGGNDGSSC